jgi:Fibronectin type III domain
MGGGVWKSTDGGATWTPKSDGEASLAIGALAVDPNSANVVYAGTGEDNTSTSMYGQGILKSVNGGDSWTLLGQSTFHGLRISAIAIDRTTSGATQHVFAATDAGLYVSTDGGAMWSLNASLTSAAIAKAGQTASGAMTALVQDPSTATKFWGTVGDGCDTEHGNIVVSTNSGTTWSNAASYAVDVGRIAIGVGTSGVAYVAAADCNDDLYNVSRTPDGGANYTSLSGSAGLTNYFNAGSGGQGFYDNVVGVDPSNNNRILLGGVTLLAGTSSDGGTTFTFSDVGKVYSGGAIHPDMHAVAFTGANSAYVGNDGGVWKTSNLGGTGTTSDWQDLNRTLQITEFNHGTAHTTAHPMGGAQDNGSEGNFVGDLPLPTWYEYNDGDGAFTAVDPNVASSNVAYVESQYLHMFKVAVNNATTTAASPCDTTGTGLCNGQPVDFVAPFVMDPSNSQVLLAGTDRVYKTTNGGVPAGSASWAAISGPQILAAGDDLAHIVTGPGTNVIFTGSAWGVVWRTVNGGTSWTNITGNLPLATGGGFVSGNQFVSGIAYNPANPNEVWVSNGGVNRGHVFHTLNANAVSPTWTQIDGTGLNALPNAPAFSVVLDPNDPTILYVGTYYGVRVCTSCTGASASPSWQTVGTGLPNTAVPWLTFTDAKNTMVAFTRGRGAWTIPLVAGTVPGAPTNVTAVAGNASATVSWTPPASNGGSPITNYTVTPYIGASAQTPTTVPNVTSTSVTGLTNGTTYTFKVHATNGVGAGPDSAASNPVTPETINRAANPSVDFDSDRKTELGALYRGLSPADSLWFALSSSGGGPFQIYFGATSDIPVPGDYNGDGKTDAVIYRPATGLWYGPQTGAAQIVIQMNLGQPGDIPIPGDYDGDRKTDPAIWRPSTGLFFAALSGGGVKTQTFGVSTDVPVPRDYDGDGKTDFAIYRQDATPDHLGLWYSPTSGGSLYQIYFGAPGDIPVPGDYNGDKRAEAVIFRENTGLWYGPFNGTPGLFQLILGQNGDVPIPGYYDDNLSMDPAIYRKATGLWFAVLSGGGVARVDGLGQPTDVPIQKRPALAGGL